MNRGYKILMLVIWFFCLAGGINSVLAASMPPMPKCMVKARVVEADTEHSPFTDWALEQGFAGGKTSGWSVIEIIAAEEEPVVETEFADEDYCSEYYHKGRRITLQLEETYEEGAIIKGSIRVSGDEFAISYRMDGVEGVKSTGPGPDGKKPAPGYFYIYSAAVVGLIAGGVFLSIKLIF